MSKSWGDFDSQPNSFIKFGPLLRERVDLTLGRSRIADFLLFGDSQTSRSNREKLGKFSRNARNFLEPIQVQRLVTGVRLVFMPRFTVKLYWKTKALLKNV